MLPKFPADRPSSPKKCHAKNLSSHCVILKKSKQGWDYYSRCDFAHFPSSGADRAHPYSSSLWKIMENKSSSQNEPCCSEVHARHVLEVSLEHTQAPSIPDSLLQHESPLGSVLLRAEPWLGGSMHVPGDPKTDAWGSSCLHSPQPKCQMCDTSLAGRKGKRKGLSEGGKDCRCLDDVTKEGRGRLFVQLWECKHCRLSQALQSRGIRRWDESTGKFWPGVQKQQLRSRGHF